MFFSNRSADSVIPLQLVAGGAGFLLQPSFLASCSVADTLAQFFSASTLFFSEGVLSESLCYVPLSKVDSKLNFSAFVLCVFSLTGAITF